MAKGIRLLDKIAIFVYTGKKFMQVRAFERYIPLYGVQENRVCAQWLSGRVLDSRSRMRSSSLIGGTVLCMTLHLPLST